MPYEYSIDRDACTIHVRGFGSGTTADTLQLIEELQATIRDCADFDVLYDGVELQIASSATDMIRVAKALFGEAGARFRRFAIVVPPGRLALARIFAALAHPWGVTANIFRDVDSAREWLAVPRRAEPPRAESDRAEPPQAEPPRAESDRAEPPQAEPPPPDPRP